MNKHLILYSFWETELEQLIVFLKEHNYSPTEIANMELVLEKARNN